MAQSSIFPAHNVLAISRRELRQPSQAINEKANIDVEYDHRRILIRILPIDEERGNRYHIAQHANGGTPEVQTMDLSVFVVGVQWIATLNATPFDILVVAGRWVGGHQRRHTCAGRVEFHFAHIIVALGWEQCFVAFEKFRKEWGFVQQATRFEGDATLLERRKEHHVTVWDAFAFRDEHSTEEWLKYDAFAIDQLIIYRD